MARASFPWTSFFILCLGLFVLGAAFGVGLDRLSPITLKGAISFLLPLAVALLLVYGFVREIRLPPTTPAA